MNFNILSVDVEEWFHPEAVRHRFPFESWPEQPRRVAGNVIKLLDLFDRHQAKATFFTLGWVAGQEPEMIREIVRRGHEIASHSHLHRMITTLTPDSFRSDLRQSIDILEQISGQKVIGFRAPTFSVVKETFWALDILAAENLVYDSSIYPIMHDRYGVPNAPRQPYPVFSTGDKRLTEFPMPTLRIFGKNIPFGGGGYMRLFPLFYTAAGIRRYNKTGQAAILYMHPWEFDADQPKLDMGFVQKFRHYHNIKENLNRLDVLLRIGTWISFRDYLEINKLN